jgi:hypothetical protein
MFGVPVIKTAIPLPTEAPPPTRTPAISPKATYTPSPQPTETPTVVILHAPVIDTIDFPDSIVCDGRRYDVPIRFHDADGDAHRIQWELRFTKKNTPLYTTAKEFVIDSQTQISGTTFYDFIQWHVPGDEVVIRVHIEDRAEQSGFLDFEFKCSK